MKRLNLEPTDENVIAQFCNDSIGRNIDVLQFVSLLNSIDENCSIAVDALWGAGKTFFVKQVKMVLDAYNNFTTSIADSGKTEITNTCEKAYQCQEFSDHPQLCVYYDAWENDNDDEPVLSLVHSIMKEISSTDSFKEDMQSKNVAKILAGLVDAICGTQTAQLADAMKCEDYLESIKDGHSIRSRVNDFFNKLFQEKGNRLVIIVDELDRCNPDYTVRLLERIKHYFSNKNITFVFAINSHQLQHTIKHHYGVGFDASRYLDRFFDLTIELPPINMSRFYQSVGLNIENNIYTSVCGDIAELFNLQMRERSRFHNITQIILYRVAHFPAGQIVSRQDRGTAFCQLILTPFLIALRMTDKDVYFQFISGQDGSAIQKIRKLYDKIPQFMNWLLSSKETFSKDISDTRKVVTPQEKLDELYRIIFVNTRPRTRPHMFGQMLFLSETKSKLLKEVSGLSGNANYIIDVD